MLTAGLESSDESLLSSTGAAAFLGSSWMEESESLDSGFLTTGAGASELSSESEDEALALAIWAFRAAMAACFFYFLRALRSFLDNFFFCWMISSELSESSATTTFFFFSFLVLAGSM